MKPIVAAACALALSFTAGAAWAADPVDAAYDWSGFHAGAHAGYAFGGEDAAGVTSSTTGFLGNFGDLELSGIHGGVQAGYNIQHDNLVFGLEADVSAGDVDDDAAAALGGLAVATQSDVNVFGTFRGRAGFAMDRLLVYGTGGLAWGDVDYTQSGVNGVGVNYRIDENDFELGFAAGGGVEYAISENLSAGVQYLYYNLDGGRLNGPALTPAGVPTGEVLSTVRTTDFHAVRFNLNWSF